MEFWSGADFCFNNSAHYRKFYDECFGTIVEQWAQTIVDYKAEWIGMSILSSRSGRAAESLAREIKKINPKQKIVIGGTGCGSFGDAEKGWGKYFLQDKLADYFISGEGEVAILELTKGNVTYPGINSAPIQLTNEELNSIPPADYSDQENNLYPYNIHGSTNPDGFMEKPKYSKNNQFSKLYIESSRGCINNCSFCDIRTLWKKFRYREASCVVAEMIHFYERYECKDFYFADSLINGNLRFLKDLCLQLIEYQKRTGAKFQWEGYFLCRNRKVFSTELYGLLAASGYKYASVGLKSASNKILKHMKKGYDLEEAVFTIENLVKSGIHTTLLFLIGYPTETEVDFQENIKLLDRLVDMGLSHKIRISPGDTMQLGASLPIWKQREKLGMRTDAGDDEDAWQYDWYLGENTLKVRLRRYLDLVEHAENLNYGINNRSKAVFQKDYQRLVEAENQVIRPDNRITMSV